MTIRPNSGVDTPRCRSAVTRRRRQTDATTSESSTTGSSCPLQHEEAVDILGADVELVEEAPHHVCGFAAPRHASGGRTEPETLVLERGDKVFVVTVALGDGEASDADRDRSERLIQIVASRL